MGSVHQETLGQGRGHHDFDYMPLSDPAVVLKLIENRMKADASYAAKVFPESAFASNGGIVFVESVTNTYIDLDRAIADAKMSAEQRSIVERTMLGWSCTDIAEEKHITRQAVAANNARWHTFINTYVKSLSS